MTALPHGPSRGVNKHVTRRKRIGAQASPRTGSRNAEQKRRSGLAMASPAPPYRTTECMTHGMEASACPMCSRALKISTIEPYPTRDRVDVVTYRCPIHGHIWTSIVVNRVEAANREIAALLPPCCDQSGFVWPGTIEPNQSVAKQRNSWAGACREGY